MPANHCHCFLFWGDKPSDYMPPILIVISKLQMTKWVSLAASLASSRRTTIKCFLFILCLLSRSYLVTPAVEPSCGDRADVSRCVNEQHDGEDIRSMLHGPHVVCARAGEHSRGLTWKGSHTHSTHTQPPQLLRHSLTCNFHIRWINMPRSCWQPWVQEWRRKMIQVSQQQIKSEKR